ncbi:precorrin-2 C20-methyltransferase [Megasphaera cerevisiae DSM 20462]|uniref:Precorrin-2 C20-methyltransferase n=1 Tax=Megasphaera cerevisiae DSM 20462 TaxID=1122219 RepID=A0A0J6ZSA6_9FIRM|nr:precorrin-2 C(20)-methyltransferase [Megasphaera cerevisiae]KMO87846.1 precorrin-2 C20-methyltransferase [Megasphaera cerevisiae DSM 20462]OKY54367.1 precorrin-2 C(20)-methyltransferase [Megasphaera cerevisiae]SJZ41751.1 precorrin-2/cobalt-factor-2 C20-methyltransferase [Megasphaera cerevisiae DSM 20462]
MKGTLYCIGVGPGDPELLTLKAWKRLRSCSVLAVPQGHTGVLTAKQILLHAIEQNGDIDVSQKKVLVLDFPMTRDAAVLSRAHAAGAAAIEQELQQGRDVALITLGCPTVYATSIYVHRIVRNDGYETEIIPGIPSFCAAAARLQQPLCEKNELLVIIPGGCRDRKKLLELPGNKVIMKPPGDLTALKEELKAAHILDQAAMIERCGLPGEAVYNSLAAAEDTGYFSVVLVKESDPS